MKPFTADRVGDAVAALEFVLSELQSAGINPSERGRLHQHLQFLKLLVGLKQYPDDPSLRPKIASAMGDAAQFSHVVSLMPFERVGSFIQDLKRALGGSQTRSQNQDGEPYQLQSQLVFGSMLAAAGHQIIVRDGPGLPDFFAPNGTMQHGIEVKRPGRAEKIPRTLGKAADQIEQAGGFGMVVLDASDVLRSSYSHDVEHVGDEDRWRSRFQLSFRSTVAEIGRLLQEPGSTAPRNRYKGLVAYCVLASGWIWCTSECDPIGWPEYRALFYSRRLYRVHNLAFYRGTWLRDMVDASFRSFSGTVMVTAVD